MRVGKQYKLFLSKRLPNGILYSIEFKTYLEDDNHDEKELFDKAYKSTLLDIKNKLKTDIAIKYAWKDFIDGLNAEEKINECENKLEEPN